jgi:chemotaxis protein CheX
VPSIKALIAISDRKLADELAGLINDAGGSTRLTPDGSMANFALKSEAFHILVIESKLPSMNGFLVMNNARQIADNKNIAVIFMADDTEQDTIEKVKLLKYPVVVSKSSSASEILAKMEGLTGKQNSFKYDVKIVNTFIESAVEIFEHYFKKKPELGKIYIRKPEDARKGEITGLISLTGSGFLGSLALNVTHPFCSALGLVLFEGQNLKIDDTMASDLCGEICNQIVGKVKIRFGTMGVKATIGLPEVIVGKDHKLIHKVKNPILTVPIKVNGHESEFEFCLDKADVEVNDQLASAAPASDVILF